MQLQNRCDFVCFEVYRYTLSRIFLLFFSCLYLQGYLYVWSLFSLEFSEIQSVCYDFFPLKCQVIFCNFYIRSSFILGQLPNNFWQHMKCRTKIFCEIGKNISLNNLVAATTSIYFNNVVNEKEMHCFVKWEILALLEKKANTQWIKFQQWNVHLPYHKSCICCFKTFDP